MNVSLHASRTFVIVLFIGLFAMAARNVTDPDVWWHLKTGQYIAEHKSVPRADPFSFTRGGKPWIAHEWLTELFLYETWRYTGWGGLIVIFAAILCAAFLLLYLRCGSPPYIAGVATLVAAWTTMPVWGVRPQVISLLLTSLWLLILERSEKNPRLLWCTLPLTLLWVNLHAGFALGLALFALFLAGNLLERAVGHSQQDAKRMRTAAFILLLDLLLVPLNPNGMRMFFYPVETLRSSAMQSYIAEWASPNFHHAEYWPFLLLILATFAALGWSRRGVRPRGILLLIVSLYAGLVSIRMIPLFALIAIPLLAGRIGEWPRAQHPNASGRMFINGGIVLAMAVFAAFHVVHVIRFQPQAEMQNFPVRAVAFLKTHPADRVFNHYDWGGYLIWKLYPETRVFIDGRADLYSSNPDSSEPDSGKRDSVQQNSSGRGFDSRAEQNKQQLLDQFAHTYQLQDNWQQALEQWAIHTVLVPVDSPLATGLRSAPGWTAIYADSQAIIFTARGSEL